jgi:hypothetical protein
MKYRNIPGYPDVVGYYHNEYDNTTTPMHAYRYAEISEMDGPGRYGYPRFPKDRDVGGSFFRRADITLCEGTGVGTVCGQGAYSKHKYTGMVFSEWIRSPNTGRYWPPNTDGSAFGATAYNKMKPTKPTFEAGNAIWEFREVPAQLRQRLSKDGLKNIADYWLALQFGWKPLLNDIRHMLQFQQKAQKKIAWLLRRNGKPTSAACQLVDDTSDPVMTENIYGSSQPGFVNQFYLETPTWRRIETVSDKIWARARFRFWLPPGPADINHNPEMLRRLYGLYCSPQFCWNALPWTWLIDWFSNAGDVLENLDVGVADRLAADWFYVMREKAWDISHTNNLKLQHVDGTPVPVSVTSHAKSVIKTRLKGDPFGFATPSNSLSGMQLSILGSLGLSRLR